MFRLACRAFLHLLIIELPLIRCNFGAIHRRVRTCATAPPSPLYGEREVLRAVDLACAFYFKEVLCLQRSAATACLLRHCGVRAEMVIGVRQMPFQAHAWAEVNGRCVTDRPYIPSTYFELERC